MRDLQLILNCFLIVCPNLYALSDFLSILNQLDADRNLKEVTIVHSFTPTIPGWSSVRAPRFRHLQNTKVKVTFLDSTRLDGFIRLSARNGSAHRMATTMFLALNCYESKVFVRKAKKLLSSASSIVNLNAGKKAIHRLKRINFQMVENPRLQTPDILSNIQLLIPIPSLEMISIIVSDLYLPLNTQVYFIFLPSHWEESHPLSIYEAYHTQLHHRDNLPLRLTILPLDTTAKIPSSMESLWGRRGNLGNTTLRGGVRMDPPWVIFNSRERRKHHQILPQDLSGFMPEIWSELETLLNFSTVYQRSSAWGTVSSDGRWLGLVGMLQRKEIDVAVVGLTVTANRQKVVDFTPNLYHENYRVYFDKSKESYVASITEVMTWDILLFIIVVVNVASMAQAFVFRLTLCPKDRRERYTMDAIFFNNLYAFFQQGTLWKKTSKLFTSQLVLWVTYICGMIVFNMYSATLISRLTYARVDFPYYNLVELAASGKFSLIAVRGTGSLAMLKNCNNDSTCEADQNSDETDMPLDAFEGIDRVCRGDYAFYTSGMYGFQKHRDHYHHRYYQSSCQLDFLQTRDVDGLSIGMAKGLPYRRIINFYLKKMAEGGILQRVRDKWYRREEDTPEWIPSSINLRQAAPLFWWNAFGILVSLLVLLAEMCVFAFRKRRLLAKERMHFRRQAYFEFIN